MNPRAAVAVVLAATAFLSACDAQRSCSVVGGRASSIEFALDAVVTQHPGEQLRAVGCVETVCTSEQLAGSVVVFRGKPIADKPLRVRLTITDRAGHSVFDASTTVRPSKEEVNGPGCPPTTWQARVAAQPGGTLRPATVAIQ